MLTLFYLKSIIREQAMLLIGAEKVTTWSVDRRVHRWILPHSPAPNALPRFKSGRLCYEVNWKRGYGDELNAEYLNAIFFEVILTQVRASPKLTYIVYR